MARIRSIKPEFWTSEQVVNCSPIARLLFIGMWNFCDDGGNIPASYRSLKLKVLPLDDVDIFSLMEELFVERLVVEYEADGLKYWHITGWKHQRINKPSPLKYPPYPASDLCQVTVRSVSGHELIDEHSVSGHELIDEHSDSDHSLLADYSREERKGREGMGEDSIGGDRIGWEDETSFRLTRKLLPFPPDFKLSAESIDHAKAAGLSDDEINLELKAFIARYGSSGVTKSNWQEFWRGWINNINKFGHSKSGGGNNNSKDCTAEVYELFEKFKVELKEKNNARH